METQAQSTRRRTVVLPNIGLSLPQIAKKAGQGAGLFVNNQRGRRLSIISTGLMDRSQTMSKSRSNRMSAASNAVGFGNKLSKKAVKDKEPDKSFTPKYDENEKPPAVRFIYSEAVRKTLKRCGLPMSRLARSKASAMSPIGYMDNTDDSLEIACLEDISTGVLERIQLRQTHPSRYGRQDTKVTYRMNSSMRNITSRASRINSMKQSLVSGGLSRADTGIGSHRLPPVHMAFNEDDEGDQRDVQEKIEALVNSRMVVPTNPPKSSEKVTRSPKNKQELDNQAFTLPPLPSSKNVTTGTGVSQEKRANGGTLVS